MVCEPYVSNALDLAALLSGDGRPLLQAQPGWRALAAHLPQPVALDISLMERLARLERDQWVVCDPDDPLLQALHASGLVLASDDGRPCAEVDARLRSSHWCGLPALLWQQSRWQGQDSVGALAAAGMDRLDGLIACLGLPPESAAAGADSGIALPASTDTALEALLRDRVTCRNFDPAGSVTLPQLAAVLWRTVAQRGTLDHPSGAGFAKKAVPSAGGLHPTEAYLLIRGVPGLDDGAYHYQPAGHRLLPRALSGDAPVQARALRWLAGQYWFADAPVLLVMASRQARLQWKYREHGKAWRAAVLDVGHISQALYMASTELGLGAFVTAAINEVDVMQDLGLAAFTDEPLAIAGFGPRAAQRVIAELDPLGAIWPATGH